MTTKEAKSYYYAIRIVFLFVLLATIGFFGLMYALQYIILATQNN